MLTVKLKLKNKTNSELELYFKEYGKFIGSLMHPNDTDSIAASLEIARRTNLFNQVYIQNNLPKDTKILFPEWNNRLMNRWKEELGERIISDWKGAYQWFKQKSRPSYRFLIGTYAITHNPMFFRFKSEKSLVKYFSIVN